MVEKPTVTEPRRTQESSRFLVIAFALTTLLSVIGLGFWQWLKHHRRLLPDPEESSGGALVGQYLGIAYDFFLILLLGAIVFFVVKIVREKHLEFKINASSKKYFGSRLVSFVRSNPVVTIIFTVYTVILVHEATWFHGELVGWIQDVFRDNLLNNFSFRQDFINETLRRKDYRLFPLAHQDLHIYSWFTPYVKVMMLISAAQLITIVICAKRLAENISGNKSPVSLMLISAVLTLFCASIANAFFQLDYPGRMLTFLLSIYSLTYFHYLRNRDRSSFYITFLLALLGIYWKDTGFILFILPAAIVISLNFIPLPNSLGNYGKNFINPLKNWQEFYQTYRLELWLCWLFSAFILSYIYLSLIPSSYLDTQAYGSSTASSEFRPVIRFWILVLFSASRFLLTFTRCRKISLLDVLNLSAITYSLALYVLVGFKGYSYQYAPIEFITIVNILIFWCWASSRLVAKMPNKLLVGSVGLTVSFLLLTYEQIDKRYSFYGHVSRVHEIHNSWEQSFTAIDKLTRKQKKEGLEVNIIYSTQSWFDKNRHLDRFRYDRLIEWDHKRDKFIVKDGIGESTEYKPKSNDFFINIDRSDPILPSYPNIVYETVYQFNHVHTNLVNGQIYKIKLLE